MRVLGIEFAPLFIPLERRLQTASVLYVWSTFLFFGILGLITFIILLISPLYFVAWSYLVFYIYDRNKCKEGGRRCNWMREWKLNHYFRDYFPIRMIKTTDLNPEKNYILVYHPHGIMCVGAYCCFATEATGFSREFPGIVPHTLTLEGNFRLPFYRDYLMGTGSCSASKESIEYLLTKKGTGNALILVVGGAAEALDAHPGRITTLVLKRRKGFIRLALKHGASLVPVFAFGENNVFSQVRNPHGTFLRQLQVKLKNKLGFSSPLLYGRGIFQYSIGFLPYREPINVVIGAPIDLNTIDDPTEEEIQKTHDLYVTRLQELFNAHKGNYGGNLELNIT